MYSPNNNQQWNQFNNIIDHVCANETKEHRNEPDTSKMGTHGGYVCEGAVRTMYKTECKKMPVMTI